MGAFALASHAPAMTKPSTVWNEVSVQESASTVSIEVQPWLQSSLLKLQELVAMPEGWDGRGSRCIQRASAANMERILYAIAALGFPKPHMAPISGGALQIEWEHSGRSLEITTRSNGSIYILRSDENSESESDDEASFLTPFETERLKRLRFWLMGQ